MRAENKTSLKQEEKERSVDDGEASANRLRQVASFVGKASSLALVQISCLAILIFIVYGRTLTSYFLADDFGEVSYTARIFNGEPGLFFANWTGNYMQIPGMSVYRPWLLVSLVCDYLLYHANAWGYYLTNLTYFTGAVLLLYAATRLLTLRWSATASKACAFFTAALFAFNPLRCESISWVVGRVDIICSFYYLFSLVAFLLSRSHLRKPLVIIGVAAFALAMLTKEMAIGLPLVLFAVDLFALDERPQPARLFAKLRRAAQFSAPLWIATAVYFIVRFLALGTLVGGYVAGFGASQHSVMLSRWLDGDTLRRLFFPLSQYLFGSQAPASASSPLYTGVLSLFYLGFTAILALRLLQGQISWRWLAFLAVFLASTVAPIFQLWGIGYNLEGARFYLFMSMPVALFFTSVLLRPVFERDLSLERRLRPLSLALLLAVVVAFARLSYLSDLVWVHAGKEVRQVFENARRLYDEPARQYALLNLPDDLGGAHQILNGMTLKTMLQPPFTPAAAPRDRSRLLTFGALMFSPAELINSTRLKDALTKEGAKGPLIWSREAHRFIENRLPKQAAEPLLKLPAPDSVAWKPYSESSTGVHVQDQIVLLTHVRDGSGIEVDNLAVNPLDYDYLQFQARGKTEGSDPQFQVISFGASPIQGESGRSSAYKFWSGGKSFQTVRVHLSHYWRWYSAGTITRLAIVPPPARELELKEFALVRADMVAPQLSLTGQPIDTTGVQTPPGGFVTATIDMAGVTKIWNVEKVSLDVSKPNFFFDNFENQPDSAIDPVQARVDLTGGSPLKPEYFSRPGYYQLRARCLAQRGCPVGEYSDPVTVRIR